MLDRFERDDKTRGKCLTSIFNSCCSEFAKQVFAARCTVALPHRAKLATHTVAVLLTCLSYILMIILLLDYRGQNIQVLDQKGFYR